MSKQMLIIRELSAASGVDADRIVRATMGSYEFDKVIGAFGKISDLPIWYSECRDIARLCSVATRLNQRHGVRLVFVDYLQLLDLPPGETTERQVAKASSQFKRLAVKTGLSVVLLSQLSNPRDGDFSKPPSMGQLRGSGMLMADADRVVMLHRPGQGKPEEDHTLLANIAKSRNGPPGVKIEFRFHRGRILNAARQHEEALP
jgi:replicative DNA helicase